MGTSVTGILAYGIDLGGDDYGWHVQEADEDGFVEGVDWIADDDPPDALKARLLAVLAGFNDNFEDDPEWYFDRKDAAKKSLGVELEHYGMGDMGGILLVTKSYDAYQGGPTLDLDLTVDPEWDDRIRRAMSALGVTPLRAPEWILAASYG